MNHKRPFLLLLMALLAFAPVSHAQWLTQSVALKSGWNAVFLHVDTSHLTLNQLVGADANNPIQEVWRWNPPSVALYTVNPATPIVAEEWTSWDRANTNSVLQRLGGDTAYLVRVATNGPGAPVGANTYSWALKGRPVAPRRSWTISGLNLIGFSTTNNNPPNFAAFLAQAPELQSASPEIYAYVGGDLGSNNPVLIDSPFVQGITPVRRGQAFWVRSGTVFNRYFGPFEVVQAGANGVDFGETAGTSTFRLRNLSASTLTVTLRLLGSETPPMNQPPIATVPPLIVRGDLLNVTNLTFGFTNLTAASSKSWTLNPRGQVGSEVEVVLGINRTSTDPAVLAATDGALLAGILRFTDSLGFSQVDLPVSATKSSSAGLWVGAASVTHVGQYLKTYPKLSNVTTNIVTNLLGGFVTNYTTNTPNLATLTNFLATQNLLPPGKSWTPREESRSWYGVASSADGVKLLASTLNGQLYTSTDSGTNWTAREASRPWYGVASSADGTKLIAGAVPGRLYTSIDSGANWTARETNRQWIAVASSADGAKLVAGDYGGRLYTSTDSGASWTARETNRNWYGVASSADGVKLIASASGGQLYTSTDSGTNWTARETNRNWYGVASSADGTKLVAAVQNGQLYTSTDSGTNWTPRDANRFWASVASTADGTRLIASHNGGLLYGSIDSGTNWTASDANRSWNGVASSADGTRLVAADTSGFLYTSVGSYSGDSYQIETNSGRILAVSGGNAPYLSTGLDTSMTAVKTAFPLRLIVHDPTNGPAVLLQRVYYGFDPGTNVVVALGESALHPAHLKDARRISSTHFPWTPGNTPWPFDGNIGQPAILTATTTVGYGDHASNPFLHTYHPDHDNLNATFDAPQPRGRESYTVQRVITLNLQPPGEDFSSLVASGETRSGVYGETITLLGLGSSSREYQVQGVFTLYRVSQEPVLTPAP